MLYKRHECGMCGMIGHLETLHTTENKAFQAKLVKEYGKHAFGHFMMKLQAGAIILANV